ncbi:MAG: hypothetical protein MZV63_26040 [Marinilabiliales bacterium]|nr:hypothetical protein [Marinilabiliales bacterium]
MTRPAARLRRPLGADLINRRGGLGSTAGFGDSPPAGSRLRPPSSHG